MRTTKLEPNCFYHIYNRGINRQPIFFNTQNWGYFLTRLRHHLTADVGDMVACCLMPNHYHFLVYVKTEAFGLKVMQPFTVSYTKSINKQESRVGPLFQGPFQAKLITSDSGLVQASQYIHLNPVLAGLAEHPAIWQFSSYSDYAGMRQGTFPKSHHVLCHFPTVEKYKDYVIAGMENKRLEQREQRESEKGFE